MKRTRKSVRITVEALKFYVPVFNQAILAEQRLLTENEDLSISERNHLQALLGLKDLVVEKIADLSGPLITREINKLIATSHLRTREDLFDLLYYAGMDGLQRGLRKFEVDKINSSSTNYLFQWIITYANRELVILEAPFGIPPSRFKQYKKISAVRKKLTDEQGRYATNQEVLDCFQSGRADIKNLKGRVANKDNASQANLRITLSLIEEQEKFEQEMMVVDLLDPLDDYTNDIRMTQSAQTPFSETVFGVFAQKNNVSEKALAVIMNDLNVSDISDDQIALVNALTKKEYKVLSKAWEELIKDVDGPFYSFLVDNVDKGFSQFDVVATIKTIEGFDRTVDSQSYEVLFNEKGV